MDVPSFLQVLHYLFAIPLFVLVLIEMGTRFNFQMHGAKSPCLVRSILRALFQGPHHGKSSVRLQLMQRLSAAS
jgi:hypothetical protein